MAINRKEFLKSLGGLAALTIIPRRVLGGPGHIAPNDQLTKGIIGMGGIGFSENHFSSNEQCRLVAVCDVDDLHLQKGVDLSKERLGETVKGTGTSAGELRFVIDRKLKELRPHKPAEA
ncbi:MAG: hypothetical protein IKL12_00930, partial [Alistipes sp.]|nr:hypothetical protein [Alistipes sp.]